MTNLALGILTATLHYVTGSLQSTSVQLRRSLGGIIRLKVLRVVCETNAERGGMIGEKEEQSEGDEEKG